MNIKKILAIALATVILASNSMVSMASESPMTEVGLAGVSMPIAEESYRGSADLGNASTGNVGLGSIDVLFTDKTELKIEHALYDPTDQVSLIRPPVIIEPPPPPIPTTGISVIIYWMNSDKFKEWANEQAEKKGEAIPYPELTEDNSEEEDSSNGLEESGEYLEGMPQWLYDFATFAKKYLNPVFML